MKISRAIEVLKGMRPSSGPQPISTSVEKCEAIDIALAVLKMTEPDVVFTSGEMRRIDDMGRVLIPKSIRMCLGLRHGDAVEFSYSTETQTVYIHRYEPIAVAEKALNSLWIAVERDPQLGGNKDILSAMDRLQLVMEEVRKGG